MFLSTKIGYEFLHVPKLDVAGTNWVIYKDCFLWSVEACGLLEHIDGSISEPEDPLDRTVSMAFSQAELAIEEEWKKSVEIWKQHEAIVKLQIARTIPDSLFTKIHGSGSARDIWETLSKNFQPC
jgi:hypothetical protein